MSDISNVRCKACVMDSFARTGGGQHVEGCPYASTLAVDRAAEAPRILGVEMRLISDKAHGAEFASLEVSVGQLPFDDGGFQGFVGRRCVHTGSQVDAVAAIERELLAIRDAIPARAAEPPQPASVGGEAGELCKCGCPKLWHVPHHAHTKLSPAGTFCSCYDFEPAEPPHPSNEPVVTAEWIAVMRKALHANPEALAALSELERRLTVKK